MSPRRRPRPSRYNTLTELENQLTLASWLEQHLDDWQGPNSPTGAGVQAGSHSDPTLAAVVSPDRDTVELITRTRAYLDAIIAIEDTIANLKGTRCALQPLTQDQARRAHQPDTKPGVGSCLVDAEWVTGTNNDRLRAGLCHTHYTAWCRAGRPDKALWIEALRSAPVTTDR